MVFVLFSKKQTCNVFVHIHLISIVFLEMLFDATLIFPLIPKTDKC